MHLHNSVCLKFEKILLLFLKICNGFSKVLVYMHVIWIVFVLGVMDTQATPPAPPKSHPPHSNGLKDNKKMKEDIKYVVKCFKDRFSRTPFYEYFMSEVNLLSNFDLHVCAMTFV